MVLALPWSGTERDFCRRDGFPTAERKPAEGFMTGNNNLVEEYHCKNTRGAEHLAIEAALRECCDTPFNQFALALVQDDNQVIYIASEGLKDVEKNFFSAPVIDSLMGGRRGSSRNGGYTGQGHPQNGFGNYGDMDNDSEDDARRKSCSTGSTSSQHTAFRRKFEEYSEDDHPPAARTRIRRRGNSSWDQTHQTVPRASATVPPQVRKSKLLIIGNKEEVSALFAQRFKDLQQNICKNIAKIFVKAIEPKKQTKHPYSGGPEKAPSWWPPTPPGGKKAAHKNGYVRHKEPDHLLKPERINLLVCILDLVTAASHQKAPQMRDINVEKLEELTNEAQLFANRSNVNNACKLQYLKEIFKVARQQERLRNGEIDETTAIPVMHCNDRPGINSSDDELDEGFQYNDDDDDDDDDAAQDQNSPIHTMSPTSGSINSDHHARIQGHLQTPSVENDVNHGFGAYMPELPGRSYHQEPIDDQLSYAQVASSHNHMPNQANYMAQVPTNYQQPSSTRHISIRRLPCSSNNFPNHSPFFSNLASNADMVHNPTIQYNTFPGLTHAHSAQSGVHGPYLPHPTSMPMSIPAINPPQHQIFNDGRLANRAHETVQGEVRIGNPGYLHRLPQLPHRFQDFLQDEGYGPSPIDSKEDHIKATTSPASRFTLY